MDRDYYRYEDSYGRSRKKSNMFGWSVAILLLTGTAFAAWLGSFYIFGQPERPESYRILKKLHKIDPTKRFELTAAPSGEFLTAKQLYDRYIAMSPTELGKTNAELVRNYIRNFQSVRGLVPYLVGRFNVVEARELTPNDVFTSGMVALTNAVDHGETLMEHVYPSDPQALPLMKQTLVTGLEIKLERTHDLSAVIHAERLADGRIMITAMPLLYGSYTVTRGPGTFTARAAARFESESRLAAFQRIVPRSRGGPQSRTCRAKSTDLHGRWTCSHSAAPGRKRVDSGRASPANRHTENCRRVADARPSRRPRQKAGSWRRTGRPPQRRPRRSHLARL